MTNTNEKYIAINHRLIKILDELLASGDWRASLFLRNTSKRFEELRKQAQDLSQRMSGTAALNSSDVVAIEKTGYCQVFVSLYQAEGSNLQKWHHLLKTLTEYSISRPVYRDESYIQKMMRAKENIQREAYVSVWIKPGDIIELPGARVAMDRLGQEMLTLKAGAIKPENIIAFAHCQKLYDVCEQGLVLKAELNQKETRILCDANLTPAQIQEV